MGRSGAKIVEAIQDSGRRDALLWNEAHFPALFAIETRHWKDAASLVPLPKASPRITTETYWARTIGTARMDDPGGRGETLIATKNYLMICSDPKKVTGLSFSISSMMMSSPGAILRKRETTTRSV